MNKNRLIIAAAGSGKTTMLINEALKISKERILITTYTQANEDEIRKKFYKVNKYIPENVDIETWFSFLLKHGVRPYQNYLYEKDINGLILMNYQSAKGSKEINIQQHYLTSNRKIYSDKISKFIVKCNERGNGCVIGRLSRIYSHIFIDEIQDLAGYDLEFLKLIFFSNSHTLLVGDPRQGTYSTNTTSKNKKYRKSNIVNFFEQSRCDLHIDENCLRKNYRCVPSICFLSDKLFPEFPCTESGNYKTTGHDGVFLVKPLDVDTYLQKYNPTQLRDTRRTSVNPNYNVMNFGESKGLSFDRILIYPTEPQVNWLINNKELVPTSRSKFYVAITRARFSVGIVYDFNGKTSIEGVEKFINEYNS